MIVELFGLPGSGKSTLWRALRDRNPDWADGYKIMPGHSIVRCARQHPVIVGREVARAAFLGRRPLTGAGRRVVSWRLRQCIAASSAVRKGASVCLFQEASAQEAWRVLQHDPYALTDRVLRRLVPAADLTIVLDVPAGVARERLGHRMGPPLPPDAPLDSPEWSRAEHARARLLSALHSGGTVETTSNVDDPAETVEWVEKLITPATARG